MSEVLDMTRWVPRALFLLFLFFCVATTPGIARSTVIPVEEEHNCTRETVLVCAAVSRADREARFVPARITAKPSRRDTFDAPLLAISGHCLSNGLRAPLRI